MGDAEELPENIRAEIELLSENYGIMGATLAMLNRDDTNDEEASGLARVEAKIRAILETFSCPTPFHAVRARFMGNIASPILSTSPIRTIEDFWPDGLPIFDSEEQANDLMHGLMGLWNHLAQNQKRSKPFKLTIKPFGDDRDSM